MKICPQCQTKYTDDTLKFCLQDGSSLKLVTDEKTIVFDQDSFANEKTIAENFSSKTEEFGAETIAFEKKQSDENQKEFVHKEYVAPDSQETIPRQRKVIPTLDGQTNQTNEITQATDNNTDDSNDGFGFLSGFLIAIFLAFFIGFGILAVVYLPSFFDGNVSVNSKNNSKGLKKERTLSDTEDVKTSASTSRKAEKGNFYTPNLAFDGNSRTAWSEGVKGPGIGEWIAFDFNKEVVLKKIIIEPGYFKTSELWAKNNRLKRVNLKFSDGTTKSVNFPNEMTVQTINTERIKTKSVMITIKSIYGGRNDSEDTLISEVEFVVE